MDSRSNIAITRQDYTEDMEHASGFNVQPQRVDRSAFCDSCGLWKHDIVKVDGKNHCGSCSE